MIIKRNTIFLLPIWLLFLILSNTNLMGQEDNLTKEVQVVKPYEPSISDAFKLNRMPQVEDTIQFKPTFNYNLALRPVSSDFTMNPIPAARMVAEPLGKVYRSYIKAGFGNYNSPLAEIYFSNIRSKNWSYGAWVKHNSSFGTIKLDNSEKTDAGFTRTGMSVFGKRMFENTVLSTSGGFNYFTYNFYGFDTSAIPIPIPIPLTTDEQAQRLINVGISYYSTHSDSTHINYKFNTSFNSFTDKFSMDQNSFNIKANLDKFFKTERVGTDIEFTHHMKNELLDSANNSIFRLSPWLGLFGKQWRVKVGLTFTYDANSSGNQSHFYPMGQLSYDIVSHYVIPYVEFSGFLEENHYSKLLSENPWVMPGLDAWNSSHKFIMHGGVKGNLSPRIAYNLCANFSLIDSMHFYVNPRNELGGFLDNKFSVVFDNVQHKQFMGELTVAATSSINLFFQAEYNTYITNTIEKPWHKPSYIGRVLASYNIQNKILLKSGLYIEGKRYVQSFNGSPIEIDGLIDLNLGIEYRYNSRLSGFLDLNNLTNHRYSLWHLYPMQQFNMRIGATYTF